VYPGSGATFDTQHTKQELAKAIAVAAAPAVPVGTAEDKVVAAVGANGQLTVKGEVRPGVSVVHILQRYVVTRGEGGQLPAIAK
jgi:hypothetical protein